MLHRTTHAFVLHKMNMKEKEELKKLLLSIKILSNMTMSLYQH